MLSSQAGQVTVTGRRVTQSPDLDGRVPSGFDKSHLLPFGCVKVCNTRPFLLHSPQLTPAVPNGGRGRKLHRRYADVAAAGEKGDPFQVCVHCRVIVAVVYSPAVS